MSKVLKHCGPNRVVKPRTGNCVLISNVEIKKLLKEGYIVESPSGPPGPAGPGPKPVVPKPSKPSKVIEKCPDGVRYRNPKTNRCVMLLNKDIQELLRRGYTLQDGFKLIDVDIKKVDVTDPDVIDDADAKVIVPENVDNVTQLVICGKNKVINPQTGRCIDLNGPTGKKLTSKPYVIVNPPELPKPSPKPPKPSPKPVEPSPKPVVPKSVSSKLNKLDVNEDGYVSIKEYLDSVQSLGESEKPEGAFYHFSQTYFGISFIVALIINKMAPINDIACIPITQLCTFVNKKRKQVKLIRGETDKITETVYMERCLHMRDEPSFKDFTFRRDFSYYLSTILIAGVPFYDVNNKKRLKSIYNNMAVLVSPSLRDQVMKCKQDKKRMVICNVALYSNSIFAKYEIDPEDKIGHSNLVIFDMDRRIVERFDPHGNNTYTKVYDTDDDTTKRKDFKFGLKDKKLISKALFDQAVIDTMLQAELKKILPEFTYKGVNETVPYLGPQIKADAYNGLCLTWSYMYAVLRILNADMSPAEVTIRMIQGSSKDVLDKILRFQKFMIKLLQKEDPHMLQYYISDKLSALNK